MPKEPPRSIYWEMYRRCWKKARAEGLKETELLERVSACILEQARTRRKLGEAEDGKG